MVQMVIAQLHQATVGSSPSWSGDSLEPSGDVQQCRRASPHHGPSAGVHSHQRHPLQLICRSTRSHRSPGVACCPEHLPQLWSHAPSTALLMTSDHWESEGPARRTVHCPHFAAT